MTFGIPKELSLYTGIPEYRVAISPMGVRELTSLNAKVYIENGAGEGANFPDIEYEKNGATIVFSKEEVYKRADIVVKVQAPQPEEYKYIKEEQILTGFLHLITAPKDFIKTLIDKKITAIGYELIKNESGRYPIVQPMSDIAGKLSVQIAGRLLESASGGRGILLGGIPGIPSAEVVILGAGILGQAAARSFSNIGANVYVLDLHRKKFEEIIQHFEHPITTLFASNYNIEKVVKFADVIIGAVSVPGQKTPILITKEMIKSMKKGAVIMDFSINQGGCVETSKISPTGKFIYIVDDVIHFCMPNTPTLVARTTTHVLTGSLIPYFRHLIKEGLENTLTNYPEIQQGIYIDKGKMVKEYLY